MNKLEIPELAIGVAAQNHNPTVLNADFLAYNRIVPETWVPNEDRLSTPVLSQVAYEDQGVSIVSQPDKVHFTRRNGDLRASSEPDLAGVAISYVNALPHVEYTAMAVNVEGHVIVPEGIEAARGEIVERYLAAGAWHSFGDGIDEAVVTLAYDLDPATLRLSISPALFVAAGEDEAAREVPVIRYSAHFQVDVSGEGREARLADLVGKLGRWREWLDVYLELVEGKLLGARV